jgi:hypothetical protein
MSAHLTSAAGIAAQAGGGDGCRPVAVSVAASVGWEVDAADGSVVYLGTDITLADEIYRGLPPGAHLFRAPRPSPRRRGSAGRATWAAQTAQTARTDRAEQTVRAAVLWAVPTEGRGDVAGAAGSTSNGWEALS